MEETLTLTLKKPLKIGDQIWADLTLVEPTLGQVQEAAKQGDQFAVTITLISGMCKVPQAALKQMAISDFRRIDSFFVQFSRLGPEPGASL